MSSPHKRNILNPYSALLTDIRSFVKQLTESQKAKRVVRGSATSALPDWLKESVRTAHMLGYRVELVIQNPNESWCEIQVVMVENKTPPSPNFNWVGL